MSKNLPTDPDCQNQQRVAWARAALRAFMERTNQDDDEEALGDLIADLLHLGAAMNIDHRILIDRAVDYYEMETLSEIED